MEQLPIENEAPQEQQATKKINKNSSVNKNNSKSGDCSMVEVYTVDKIKQIVNPIAKRYGVKKLALFSSYARGTQKKVCNL
ncbi:MAG: hypothetical protein FWD52_07135 [Candidatus Bathyarchaeota archaeon]|nr:hypothetical protein [Candidatus Termiticorpusculum sp.]